MKYCCSTVPTRVAFSAALALCLLIPQLPAAAQQDQISPGYWHTDGTEIVDAQGEMVRMAGVNWYGMDDSHWVPAGLDAQPYTTVMDEVKLLGYNTIRLLFSNELVERNPVVRSGVKANPQFRGEHALQVMDAIVAYAQQIGLKILLDDDHSAAPRPMKVNNSYEPLWYTSQYPESAWIQDWQTLATRYLNDDAVIGFDLRNEPHTGGSGPWNVNAYLHQGATWGPYHGVDNQATDWRLAAERAGNAVLAINPRLLIYVEGVEMYPDTAAKNGVDVSWWGGLLTPVKKYPVVLSVPNQLVYEVHQYGPRKQEMPWYKDLSYQAQLRAWHAQWSFVLDNPGASYAAPVWLGEFGTCTDDPGCVQGKAPQARWLGDILEFLSKNPSVAWSFFALNGTNSNNCAVTNGLLNSTWNGLASLPLQRALMSAQPAPPPMSLLAGAALPPGTGTSWKPRSASSPLCQLP
jgi:endoglucanase